MELKPVETNCLESIHKNNSIKLFITKKMLNFDFSFIITWIGRYDGLGEDGILHSYSMTSYLPVLPDEMPSNRYYLVCLLCLENLTLHLFKYNIILRLYLWIEPLNCNGYTTNKQCYTIWRGLWQIWKRKLLFNRFVFNFNIGKARLLFTSSVNIQTGYNTGLSWQLKLTRTVC